MYMLYAYASRASLDREGVGGEDAEAGEALLGRRQRGARREHDALLARRLHRGGGAAGARPRRDPRAGADLGLRARSSVVTPECRASSESFTLYTVFSVFFGGRELLLPPIRPA